MAESLQIPRSESRAAVYEALTPQIEALIGNERDTIAAMANLCAALRQAFGFFWVGFYRVFEDELVLGPFQGDLACTRIGFGKGVCGTAWQRAETLIVPDVDAFPGHIACSSLSRSEIVVPIIRNNGVVAVLDVDSTQLNDFSEVDQAHLEKICSLLPYF